MDKMLLRLQQTNGQTIGTEELRQIWFLLNSLEGIQKTLMVNDEKSPLQATDQRARSKEFQTTYRFEVVKIEKNSPLLLSVAIGLPYLTDKLLNHYFSEEQQEQGLKELISEMGNIDFDQKENQARWKSIWGGVKDGRKAIAALGLVYEFFN